MGFERARSPLGAFVRSPLGAFSKELEEEAADDEGLILGLFTDQNSRNPSPICPDNIQAWIYNLYFLGDISGDFPGTLGDYTISFNGTIDDADVSAVTVITGSVPRASNCGGSTASIEYTRIDPVLVTVGPGSGVPGSDGPPPDPWIVTITGPGGVVGSWEMELCDTVDETDTNCNPIQYSYTSPVATP